jgi:hypothetical protein
MGLIINSKLKVNTVDPIVIKRMFEQAAGVTLVEKNGRLFCDDKVCIENNEEITTLPEFMTLRRGLVLKDCTNLTELPKGLITNCIFIENCPKLETLPIDLWVKVDVRIAGCDGITSLPDTMVVLRNLSIENCKGFTTLPEGFKVGIMGDGRIEIIDCPNFKSLPHALAVDVVEIK